LLRSQVGPLGTAERFVCHGVDQRRDRLTLSGTLEVGSLLIGRVGLFVRAGTQLLGQRQIDYSLTGGIRYLFRLEKGRPQP